MYPKCGKEGGKLGLSFLILGIAGGTIVLKPGPDVLWSWFLILKGKYWKEMEEEYSLVDPAGLSPQMLCPCHLTSSQ